MKQTLVEGAVKISGHNMLESYEILKNYKPRATIFPNILDYTNCPYTWPFCQQSLYAGAMPVVFNTTKLNRMGVTGYFSGAPTLIPTADSGNLLLLNIRFTCPDTIWPWTGYLALHIQIKEEGSHYSGPRLLPNGYLRNHLLTRYVCATFKTKSNPDPTEIKTDFIRSIL
ncbi:hypothetical protein L1887_10702 [Cichorium endivia]|nr:hypothetical protein L1887_10702 [Cichorium endivia]